MGAWEDVNAYNVYFNDICETSIKVKSSYSLQEIRDILGIDNSYFFKNKNNRLIINDQNFYVKDIYKKDNNDEYRIDLQKDNYREGDYLKNNKNVIVPPVEIISNIFAKDDTNRNILKNEENKVDKIYLEEDTKKVNLYLNNFKNSAIAYKPNMNLGKIKELGGDSINKDSIFFLTKDNTIIEKIDNFLPKDCLVEKNGEMKINLVTKDYYKRIEIIDHLDKFAALAGPIDWYVQEVFFKKIKDYVGEQIANVIIDDIYLNLCQFKKIDDKKYVKQFKNLLIGNNNIKRDNNNHDNNNDNNVEFIIHEIKNNVNEENEESGDEEIEKNTNYEINNLKI